MDKTLEEFRLRIAHAQIDSEQIEQDLWEARKRIIELEAEVKRLTGFITSWKAEEADWCAENERLREALKDQKRRKREGLVATTERIRGLKTEVERLREALKAVEWVDGQDAAAGMGGEMEQVCPWCSKVGTTDDGWAHEPDCIRQAAIAKARGRE